MVDPQQQHVDAVLALKDLVERTGLVDDDGGHVLGQFRLGLLEDGDVEDVSVLPAPQHRQRSRGNDEHRDRYENHFFTDLEHTLTPGIVRYDLFDKRADLLVPFVEKPVQALFQPPLLQALEAFAAFDGMTHEDLAVLRLLDAFLG